MLLTKEGKGVKMKISFTLDEDRVIVTLVGKATTSDFKAQKDELDSAVEKWSDKEWVINCKDLLYIPSSGLRWLLSIQKRVPKEIQIVDVRQPVMEILFITGLNKLFSVRRGMRRISVNGCEQIGQGANGEVYRLKDETIVKVFFDSENLKNVETEDRIAHAVLGTGLPAVITYDIVKVGQDRYGIVYETLGAKTLSETIEEDPSRFDEWMAEYVELYRQVHETDGRRTRLPLTKNVYRKHLCESADWYTKGEMEQLLRLLESIPDRNTLIHGDYHPNNIMVNDGELIMIDLGDFSIGHPVFDFLATAATQANLVELSPKYAEFHTKMKAERIRKGWSTLLDLYFSDRTPQQRGEIDAQVRLLSKLKVACAPAVAKGISDQLMEASIKDVKENLIPRIDELIGVIDW